MIEYDKGAIGRIKQITEGGAMLSKKFAKEQNKHIPTWLLFTWWVCFFASISLVGFIIYNLIT